MSTLFILSGPSGAGKDAVVKKMKDSGLSLHYAITLTTRPRREGETSGVDYHFTSETDFKNMIDRGELLEYAKVYGNWYGVPKQTIQEALDRGEDVIIKVDVQGAATIKNSMPGAALIFLSTSSVEEQEKRLRQRSTESDADLKLRLETFHEEMKSLPLFDYIVINHQGDLDSAVSQIKAIVAAEKCRVNPHIRPS